MEHSGNGKGLPENARRELKPGEKYVPIITAEQIIPEVTFRSVFLGLLFGIIFAAGTTYLTLKLAMGMEVAIPVAIIAVGLSYVFRRKSTMLENVIITSISSGGGIVAAAVVFVMPALYILKLDEYVSFFTLFFVAIAGALIGLLYTIPFRRHYVSEMHGKYPFPEATAITEVLVTGEKGGAGARVLGYSAILGGIYDFFSMTLGGWREIFTTKLFPSMSFFTSKLKMAFDINTGAAIFGMGYIIGIRYALVLASASFLSFFVLVPLVAYFGIGFVGANGKLIGDMSSGEIFSTYVRFIGIGVIAMAAILGILKSLKVMAKAVKEGVNEIFYGRHTEGAAPRTDIDIKMSALIGLLLSALVAIFIYFKWNVFGGEGSATKFSFIAIFIIAIITFLFATVAIWCTVVTARNPISGMTIVTLAIAGFSFISLGLVGKPGMAAVLIIGTIVCSGLGAAGQFSTDLKTGYWIGSTPRNQERWKYVGIIFSSLATAAVVILLNKVYGFAADRPTALPAPQANAMAAVVQMVMGDGQIPWLMYGIGAIIAILFEMVGVSPLAVGLGMYLPMHLNTAMLIGGGLSHIISNSGKTKEIGKKRNDKGILIASGFMAGGAIMGVVGAILMYIQQSTGKTFLPDFGMAGDVISGNILSVVMLGVMCIYFIWDTMKVKE